MSYQQGMGAVTHQKKLFIFGILAIGVFGLISFGPTIYAAVEPHITINMDPGQTTKPFVINDTATNTEVFAVNTDGTIKAGNFVDLFFAQTSTITINGTAGDLPSNPKILAKWELSKQAGITDSFKLLPYTGMTATGVRTVGTSTISCSLLSSTDGVTWNETFLELFFNTSTFQNKVDDVENDILDPSELFLALGCLTGSDTVGDVKEITFHAKIVVPVGHSIERIM